MKPFPSIITALASLPFFASASPIYKRAFNDSGEIPTTWNENLQPDYSVEGFYFDYASLQLGLMQEYIELDLFNYGLDRFAPEDFEVEGINADYRDLIRFMGQQEVGHIDVVSNMIGPTAVKQCKYKYDFKTVHEFIDFCARVTRWGESGVLGFLNKLENRAAAQLLVQAIAIETRQEMAFRQLDGVFAMPFWFSAGITQSMTWTQLAPFIVECPAENWPIPWDIFPGLYINNNPNPGDTDWSAAVSTNNTGFSSSGREINFSWQDPGVRVGPDGFNYRTKLGAASATPKYAAFIAQYNVSYAPLYNYDGNSACAQQPYAETFPGDYSFNGTMFIALTDDNPNVTPFNISILDQYIVAGPTIYVAG